MITVQMTEAPGHRGYTCSLTASAQSLSEIQYHVAIAASWQRNRVCYLEFCKLLQVIFAFI